MTGQTVADRIGELERVANGGGTLREAREWAGLTPRQVHMLTGVPEARVERVEADGACDAQEWEVLRAIYGVDGFAGGRPEGEAGAVMRCEFCHAAWVTESSSPHVPSAGARHTRQCDIRRELAARWASRGR